MKIKKKKNKTATKLYGLRMECIHRRFGQIDRSRRWLSLDKIQVKQNKSCNQQTKLYLKYLQCGPTWLWRPRSVKLEKRCGIITCLAIKNYADIFRYGWRCSTSPVDTSHRMFSHKFFSYFFHLVE